MLLTAAHLQKDDSMVPLLPYAAGCFLAGILLTISGIAETHPQALALAIYLIQFGWLLLQIQGAMLVQRYGGQSQCMTLFKVWLVSMQLLDVHRRFLDTFTMVPIESLSTAVGQGMIATGTGEFKTMAVQEHFSIVLVSVQSFYARMICSVVPIVCELWSSSHPTAIAMSTQMINGGERVASASTGVAGMREMEHQLLFEVLGGVAVSAIMFSVWLTMALRQGSAAASSHVRKMSASLSRLCKAIKGQTHEWRAGVGARADARI